MEEISLPNRKRLIGELINGRDSAKKLLSLLRKRIDNDGSVSTDDLVKTILGSFSNSLSTLSSWSPSEMSPISANSNDRSWDSGESEKKLVSGVKDRRGCYKRRKTEDSRIKIVDTIEDEYAWRKYGQKEILNAKFPRCYFRCTHKGDGCKALKQVQKLEDGPEMFHITYFGYHTCQNMLKSTQTFSDAGALNFYLLNFKDSKNNHSPSSPSSITNADITPSMEQEDDSNARSGDQFGSSNHENPSIALWNDIMDDFKFDESVFLQD